MRGIEDWLTVIAAGQAVGRSSEATPPSTRRPGAVYRLCGTHLRWRCVSLATPGSVGTGTAMRPDTLCRYATDAGCTAVDVLPVQDDVFRFRRLR